MTNGDWQDIGPWRQAEWEKERKKSVRILTKRFGLHRNKVFHSPHFVHPFNFCTVSVMLKYFVPAFLYCLYNNLAFVNLSAFDPTTYYLMLQLRVVVTGVLFQVFYEFISATRIFNSTLYLQLHSITVKSLSGVCVLKEIRPAFIE